MSTPPPPDLTTLNRDIAQLESEVAQLEIQRRAVASEARRAVHRDRYLRLARSFRGPAARTAHYPLIVFAVGPLAVGVLAFILLSLLLDSWWTAFVGFLLGASGAAAFFAALLYRPAKDLLRPEIADAEAKCAVEKTKLAEIVAQLTTARHRLEALVAERQQLATSGKLQRAMLLQRNWKAMRGAEWEDYVVEVCRTLGANVQRGAPTIPAVREASGPRGVVRLPLTPLFVTFSPRRYAVAAVSEIRPFHTAAVQQIATELALHGGDALAIVTNTRITTGSQELARSRNCTLIGEDEFPDFVLGKISL